MSEKNQIESALYLVPVPIGNLEDITFRAKRVLSSVDAIACEDTRNSGQLLQQLQVVYSRLISYHDHNEDKKSAELINLILSGSSVALISDAGMPAVSDPGFKLVRAAREANVKVIPLPGASASLTALVASGFPTDKFTFLGFPPQKKGRKTFIDNLSNFPHTLILYESPHRIVKLLEELRFRYSGNLRICLARELTKMYEEIVSGELDSILSDFSSRQSIKGEFTVVIDMTGVS